PAWASGSRTRGVARWRRPGGGRRQGGGRGLSSCVYPDQAFLPPPPAGGKGNRSLGKGSDPDHVLVKLEGPGAKQEIDNTALVRLQPVQLDGRQRSEVQPVDVGGLRQGPLELGILRDGAAHQRRPDA